MLAMRDDCAMLSIRVRNNHALVRRKVKALRRATKVVEMYADRIQGMIFGVCVSDTGYDLRRTGVSVCSSKIRLYIHMQTDIKIQMYADRIQGMIFGV